MASWAGRHDVSRWSDIAVATCDLSVPSLATALLLRLSREFLFSCLSSEAPGIGSFLKPLHLAEYQEDGIAIRILWSSASFHCLV